MTHDTLTFKFLYELVLEKISTIGLNLQILYTCNGYKESSSSYKYTPIVTFYLGIDILETVEIVNAMNIFSLNGE